MRVIRLGSIAIAGLSLLLLGLAAWVWSEIHVPENIGQSTAPSRGDTVLSEFYVPPARLPEDAGVLIRREEIEGASVLSSAGANLRILYSSTEGLGGKATNAVSGALYLPEGDPPEGGWPLLVWSHGTVGIGDLCAPSHAGRGERDRDYLNPWLEQGYAIAASDYQGLGTPGTHPYMDARTMAFNNLDLIRAVHSADFPLSDRVIVAGQSQGATGALATASYAPDYASDVELGGVIATGIPYFSYGVIWDLVANSDPNAVSPSLPLSLYMLTFTEMLDPDFRLEEILSEKARPVASKISQTCVFDFIEASQEAGLSSGNSFDSRPEFSLLKVLSRTRLPRMEFQTPVFAGSGTADRITPFPMQQEFISDACAAGMRISASTYSGANHNEGLLQSTADAQTFARTVLSGGSAKNTCPG